MHQAQHEHLRDHEPEHLELLAGPYQLPRLEVGDRTFCLFRDCEVIVTPWTDGPTDGPRCQVPKQRRGCGLLVDGELALLEDAELSNEEVADGECGQCEAGEQLTNAIMLRKIAFCHFATCNRAYLA